MSATIDWDALEPNWDAWAEAFDQALALAGSAPTASRQPAPANAALDTEEQRTRGAEALNQFILHSPIDVLDLVGLAVRAADACTETDPDTRLLALAAIRAEFERIRA